MERIACIIPLTMSSVLRAHPSSITCETLHPAQQLLLKDTVLRNSKASHPEVKSQYSHIYIYIIYMRARKQQACIMRNLGTSPEGQGQLGVCLHLILHRTRRHCSRRHVGTNMSKSGIPTKMREFFPVACDYEHVGSLRFQGRAGWASCIVIFSPHLATYWDQRRQPTPKPPKGENTHRSRVEVQWLDTPHRRLLACINTHIFSGVPSHTSGSVCKSE